MENRGCGARHSRTASQTGRKASPDSHRWRSMTRPSSSSGTTTRTTFGSRRRPSSVGITCQNQAALRTRLSSRRTSRLISPRICPNLFARPWHAGISVSKVTSKPPANRPLNSVKVLEQASAGPHARSQPSALRPAAEGAVEVGFPQCLFRDPPHQTEP